MGSTACSGILRGPEPVQGERSQTRPMKETVSELRSEKCLIINQAAKGSEGCGGDRRCFRGTQPASCNPTTVARPRGGLVVLLGLILSDGAKGERACGRRTWAFPSVFQ